MALSLPSPFPRIPTTSHHQVTLFGPGPWYKLLGLGFCRDLFGFGSIIDGQGPGKRREKLFPIPLTKIHATWQTSNPKSLTAWWWDLVLNLLQLIEDSRATNDDRKMKSLVSQGEAKLSAKFRWPWPGAYKRLDLSVKFRMYVGMCIFSRERWVAFIRFSKVFVTQRRLKTSVHFWLLVCSTMRKIRRYNWVFHKLKVIRMLFILRLCSFDFFWYKIFISFMGWWWWWIVTTENSSFLTNKKLITSPITIFFFFWPVKPPLWEPPI